jgi:hypothetical protein
MTWVEHVARIVEMRKLYSVIIGEAERNRRFRFPMHKYNYNIKRELKEIGYTKVNRIQLAQDRIKIRAVINIRVYSLKKFSRIFWNPKAQCRALHGQRLKSFLIKR